MFRCGQAAFSCDHAVAKRRGNHEDIWMDKGKRDPQERKRTSKPYGGRRSAGNYRGSSRSLRMGNQLTSKKTTEHKVDPDPVAYLLDLLRMNPSTDGIKNIA